MSEDKPVLTEEEIKEFSSKSTYDVGHLDRDTLEKMRNTIDKIDEDLKSLKGLERFIHEGILVTPNLIISAKPDRYHFGVYLKAFDEKDYGASGKFVNISLSVAQVKKILKLLPLLLKASIFHRSLVRLKDIYKDKSKSTSRYGRRY